MESQTPIHKVLLDQVLDQFAEENPDWRQMILQSMIQMGMKWEDEIEMRLSNRKDRDLFALAQRVANLFFSSIYLYPTALAMHPTVKELFDQNETVIHAHHIGGERLQRLWRGDDPPPISIISDEALDLSTITARFKLDKDAYDDAMHTLLLRCVAEMEKKRR